MSTLLQAHPVFKKGAVLRHHDLNNQMEYLKNLVGCSNALLAGIGVVSGFEISCEPVKDKKDEYQIAITSGVAVVNIGRQTSTNSIDALGGQLVETVASQIFLRKKNASSLPAGIEGAFSAILELTGSNDPSATPLSAEDLTKCIFVLADATTTGNNAASCFRDSEVNEQKSLRLRYFLGEPILKTETPTSTQCFAAPCIPCFDESDLKKITSIEELTKVFSDKVTVGVAALDPAIASLVRCYPGLFCEVPGKAAAIATAEISHPFYAYNYLQTLYSAYTELIALPYFQKTDPYPYKTYPSTLALGNCTGNCAANASCRHHWRDATAALAHEPEAAFYAKRLSALTNPKNLQLPNAQADPNQPSPLQLTPSRSDAAPLSQRAIPFYLSDAVFRPLWHYEATLQKTTDAIAPLKGTMPCYMEGCDWVRSEGYIGQVLSSIVSFDNEGNVIPTAVLPTLRRKKNLPFQIKVCALGSGIATMEAFSSYCQRHPGLKPCAGVPKGGTLVLLTDAGKQAAGGTLATSVIADFYLPYYDFSKPEVSTPIFILAEFIVESPNTFTIGVDGIYTIEVPANAQSAAVFFKSISENAEKFDWQIFEESNTSPISGVTGNISIAFQYVKFDISKTYKIKLTVENTLQTVSASKEKTIRFRRATVQVERVIAQFVVEAPNDFELSGPKDNIYTFPLKKQANPELAAVKVFFKSTSENATTFEWLVDEIKTVNGTKTKTSIPVVENKASDFDHGFNFNRLPNSLANQTYEVTLIVNAGTTTEQEIKKTIRGLFADFGAAPNSILGGIIPAMVEYKGKTTEKIILALGQPPADPLTIDWTNHSVNADKYLWKLWEVTVPDESKELASGDLVDFATTITGDFKTRRSFVIELNVSNNDSNITDQKNVLLDILPRPQAAIRPQKEDVGTKLVAETKSPIEKDTDSEKKSPVPKSEAINHLRARHRDYRTQMTGLGEQHPLLAKTAGHKNALAFLDSDNDLEQLHKSFKDLSLQFIRNIKLEGGVPNEVYQTVLKNLIFFCFDKLSFLQKAGLSDPFNETLDDIFGRMKSENTFPDLASLKNAWNSNDIATEENMPVIQQLNTFFA